MPASSASRIRSVRRERLLAALAEWRTCRLLRVIAPAGFGKSTLGAQWIQSLSALPLPERPARAWVALDATDDAPERFLRRFVDALRPDFPAAPELLARSLAAEAVPARILADLLALLAAHPAPVVLLFDDVHHLRGEEALSLLQRTLDDAPPNLHIALLSRTRPPLQTGRLQLEHGILSLGARDLHFDHDEFVSLVAGTPLASLDQEQLERLERRAGGWAAGLQILLQATRSGGAATLAPLANDFAAEDFWEYIEQEVLHNLPPREVDFLIDIALLPRLTSGLCAAVTGLPVAECDALLRRVSAANQLITPPTSDASSSGAMHAVLRQFLLRRLPTHHAADDLQAMRRRAAQHLGEVGEIDAALDMLLPPPDKDSHDEPSLRWLGPDLNTAADLVERAGHAALQRGELDAVRRWMRKLPESVVRTRPRLAVDSAWASIHQIETGSERYLQRIYDAVRLSPERADEALHAEIIVMEAIRRMIDGRYAEAWDALQRAHAMPIAPDTLAAAYRDSLSGYLMYGPRRSLDERLRDMQKGGECFARIGFLRGKVESMCTEASLHRIYADGPGMVECTARARRFMDETGFDAGAFRILLGRELGDALYAMNEIDAARDEFIGLQNLIRRHEPAAETPYTAQVRLQLCDLAAGSLLEIDDDADDDEWNALRRRGYGLTVLNTALRRIQRDMRRSRPDLCWRTVTSLGVLPSSLTPATPLPHTLAILAGAVFAGRDLDVVSAQLVDFRARMNSIEHRFFKLYAHALIVNLHAGQRRLNAARIELRNLLTELEPGGFMRIVLDLPALHPFLRGIDTPFAARLHAIAQGNLPAQVVISPAERRVLEQFAVGGSAARIAENLFLSVETVRSHIKTIYAKLDAHDRTQALEKAREMGIL